MLATELIFLSHSHLDQDFVTKIQSIIHSQGGNTYLDQDVFMPSDNLSLKIKEGISHCTIFLLFWSISASDSTWVEKEWREALKMQKNIIPYCLDNTELPQELSGLIHIELLDNKRANAQLLRSIFGKDFLPDSTTLFPGRWLATLNAFGMANATYSLNIRANGQLEGNGHINQIGGASNLAQLIGLNLSGFEIPISGSWTYDQGTQIFELMITASGYGKTNTDTVRIKTTGRERGAVQGQDMGGRTWSLTRIDPIPKNTANEGTNVEFLNVKLPSEVQQTFDSQLQANPKMETALNLFGMVIRQMRFPLDILSKGDDRITYKTTIDGEEWIGKSCPEYTHDNGKRYKIVRLAQKVQGKWKESEKKYFWADGKWNDPTAT